MLLYVLIGVAVLAALVLLAALVGPDRLHALWEFLPAPVRTIVNVVVGAAFVAVAGFFYAVAQGQAFDWRVCGSACSTRSPPRWEGAEPARHRHLWATASAPRARRSGVTVVLPNAVTCGTPWDVDTAIGWLTEQVTGRTTGWHNVCPASRRRPTGTPPRGTIPADRGRSGWAIEAWDQAPVATRASRRVRQRPRGRSSTGAAGGEGSRAHGDVRRERADLHQRPAHRRPDHARADR